MFCITEEQIEYILNDIRRNGVETEDLQLNLLDHICCIIEQDLQEGGDFESFYKRTVKQFYKNDLREIEEEMIQLLTFKNYYAMKRAMIVSGAISAFAFVVGSFFKTMHWPGANVLFGSAILLFGFVFLPLLAILKSRETAALRTKLLVGIGCFVGFLYAMGSLFAAQHWHGRSYLWFATVGVTMFVFIPVYFFTGIKKAETRLNTIVVTVLLVAATATLFLSMRVRQSLPVQMYGYIKNEELLKNIQSTVRVTGVQNQPIAAINSTCEQLKAAVLQQSIGQPTIPANYDEKKLFMFERNLELSANGEVYQLLMQLKKQIDAYNVATAAKIPVDHTVLSIADDKIDLYTNFSLLGTVTNVQLFLVNEQMNAASKLTKN